jgi:hypothetical protein
VNGQETQWSNDRPAPEKTCPLPPVPAGKPTQHIPVMSSSSFKLSLPMAASFPLAGPLAVEPRNHVGELSPTGCAVDGVSAPVLMVITSTDSAVCLEKGSMRTRIGTAFFQRTVFACGNVYVTDGSGRAGFLAGPAPPPISSRPPAQAALLASSRRPPPQAAC